MQRYAWIPMLVCIIGAVMILMARQRADENVRKSNSIIGLVLLVVGAVLVVLVMRVFP